MIVLFYHRITNHNCANCKLCSIVFKPASLYIRLADSGPPQDHCAGRCLCSKWLFTFHFIPHGGSPQDHCAGRCLCPNWLFSLAAIVKTAQIVANFPARTPGSWSHSQKPDVKKAQTRTLMTSVDDMTVTESEGIGPSETKKPKPTSYQNP